MMRLKPDYFFFIETFCFTVDNATRPFRRRRRSVFFPPAVLVRERKPCFFARFRFLG